MVGVGAGESGEGEEVEKVAVTNLTLGLDDPAEVVCETGRVTRVCTKDLEESGADVDEEVDEDAREEEDVEEDDDEEEVEEDEDAELILAALEGLRAEVGEPVAPLPVTVAIEDAEICTAIRFDALDA